MSKAGVAPLVVPTAVAGTTAWLLAQEPGAAETAPVAMSVALSVLFAFLVLSATGSVLVSADGAYLPYGTPVDRSTSTPLTLLSGSGLHRLAPVLVLPAALGRVSGAETTD